MLQTTNLTLFLTTTETLWRSSTHLTRDDLPLVKSDTIGPCIGPRSGRGIDHSLGNALDQVPEGAVSGGWGWLTNGGDHRASAQARDNPAEDEQYQRASTEAFTVLRAAAARDLGDDVGGAAEEGVGEGGSVMLVGTFRAARYFDPAAAREVRRRLRLPPAAEAQAQRRFSALRHLFEWPTVGVRVCSRSVRESSRRPLNVIWEFRRPGLPLSSLSPSLIRTCPIG